MPGYQLIGHYQQCVTSGVLQCGSYVEENRMTKSKARRGRRWLGMVLLLLLLLYLFQGL